MTFKLCRATVLRFGLFLCLFFGVSLVFTGTARADFNSLPTVIPHSGGGTDDPSYLQFFNLSNGANDQKTGKGADVPNGYIKIYGQDSGARSINFGVAVRRIGEDKACKGYNIRWRVHRLDASGVTSSIGPYSTIPINRCTIGPSHSGSYNFTIPAGQLNPQVVPGHVGIYEAIVQLNLQDDTNNDGFNDTARNSDGTPVTKSATLRINAGAGGKIGYAGGGYEANVYPSYDQAFDHVMSYRFRPPCTLSGPTTINLQWRDDDYQAPSPNPPGSPDGDGNGTENQYDSPRARVYEYDYAGNATGNANQRNTFYDNGPPNNRGGTTITARPGYRYVLKLESVDGGNGVIFTYPYDTGNFELPCPPPPPVPTSSAPSADINGNCNVANVYVNDGDNQGRNIKYSVVAWPIGDTDGPDADPWPDNTRWIAVNQRNVGWFQLGLPDPALGQNGWHVTVTALDLNNPGQLDEDELPHTVDWSKNGDDFATASYDVNNCYSASCTIDIQENFPGAPTGGVEANRWFAARVTFNNTGNGILREWVRDTGGTWKRLSATQPPNTDWGSGGSYTHRPFSPEVPVGDSRYMDVWLLAPSSPSTNTLNMYPDYAEYGSIGSTCTGETTVLTHQKFQMNFTVARDILPDSENPSQLQGRVPVKKSYGPDVSVTTTRRLTKNGATLPMNYSSDPNPHDNTYGADKEYIDQHNIAPGSFRLGDEFCAIGTIDRESGWRGPGGVDDVVLETGPTTKQACEKVVNRPYVRSYGSDVGSGGGFPDPGNVSTGSASYLSQWCGGPTPPAGRPGIFAYMRPINEQNTAANKSGSGSQLAAMALDNISGFMSASTRNASPQLPNGLTFGHSSVPVSENSKLNPNLGGYMSGDGWCNPDYFEETQFSDDAKFSDGSLRKNENNSPANINVVNGGLADYGQTVRNLSAGSKIRIIGDNSQMFTGHHTVYVDGDVFILNDIRYPASYGADSSTIPSFTLVVRGNIYIDNEVRQLDGLYIAQPKDRNNDGDLSDTNDAKGRIYTCATDESGDNPVTNPSLIYSDCGGNESGPARQLRVNGAFIAQRIVLNRAGWSLRHSTFKEQHVPSMASEIFNFSQEMYLSPPVFRPNGTPTGGEYDYISTLPPIL